ncbi:MAG: replication protein P [Chromatocurvus sp.]
MTDSRTLVEQVARGIAASNRTSETPPGRNDRQREDGQARIEAINQVFALFRLNYHNQYYAAFPDASQLSQIKKLWLESLSDYSVAQVLLGARHAIETSEYLPTLNRMHRCCEDSASAHGLPPARDAYREACNAPSPRRAQNWSHPAVYHAGADSDWFFLSTHSERETWPVFRDHYQRHCVSVMRGETLEVPAAPALERDTPRPLAPDEQQAEMDRLRRETGL